MSQISWDGPCEVQQGEFWSRESVKEQLHAPELAEATHLENSWQKALGIIIFVRLATLSCISTDSFTSIGF